MGEIFISDLPAHFGDGQAGGLQEDFGLVEAVRADESGRRGIDQGGHFAEELRAAHADLPAELGQSEVFVDIVGFHDAAHLPDEGVFHLDGFRQLGVGRRFLGFLGEPGGHAYH